MRKLLTTTLAAMLALPMTAPARTAESASEIDRNLLQVQVILDRLGFPPGVLDGKMGESMHAALRGFQESRGLPRSGTLDTVTEQALARYRFLQPVRTLAVASDGLKGPFINPVPHDPEKQSKLSSLAYRRPLEKLAEMFHTTPDILIALNPGGGKIYRGARFVFPNILPASRDYPADLKPEWRRTLSELNVDAVEPRADHIVVDKSEKVLKVFDAKDHLVAQFNATIGSAHDPLPIGHWKINGIDTNPKFHYNPKLFWDADKSNDPATLPPGPNGPVGVVWIDLSKEHYGIHGTPEPALIGRTASHGCIRLTNWDAARLSLMVGPGTPAIFQE